jgi:hypothetical protein
MAYTQINVQRPGAGGAELTTSAGVAGGAGTGYKMSNDGHSFLDIKNTGVGTPNVVILPGGTCNGVDLSAAALQTIALTSGQDKIAGPWGKDTYDQQGSTDPGMVYIYFTGGDETDVTIAAFHQ